MLNDSTMHGSDEALGCKGMMAKLFDLLDGELTPERERQVRLHITSCPGCFAHVDFEERFLKALRAARIAGGCPGQLRAKVMDALRADGLSE